MKINMLKSKNMFNVYICLVALNIAFVFNNSNSNCFLQNIVKAMEDVHGDFEIVPPLCNGEFGRLRNEKRDVNEFFSRKIVWPDEYLSGLKKDKLISAEDAKKIIADFDENVKWEEVNSNFSNEIDKLKNKVNYLNSEVKSLQDEVKLLKNSKDKVAELEEKQKSLCEKGKSLEFYEEQLDITRSIWAKFCGIRGTINVVSNLTEKSTVVVDFLGRYGEVQGLLGKSPNEVNDDDIKKIYQIYCYANEAIKKISKHNLELKYFIECLRRYNILYENILNNMLVPCNDTEKCLNIWCKTLIMIKIAIGGKFFKIISEYVSKGDCSNESLKMIELESLLEDLAGSNYEFPNYFFLENSL